MEPKTIQTLESFHQVLGLPSLLIPARAQDPLNTSTSAAPDDLVQVVTGAARPSRRRSPGPPLGP